MNASLLCIKGSSSSDLIEKLDNLIHRGTIPHDGFGIGNQFTLSIIAEDSRDLRMKFERSMKLLKSGKSINEPDGIYFEAHPFGSKSIAFLFPGQGSQSIGMLDSLRKALPGFENNLHSIDKQFNMQNGYSLMELVYSEPSDAKELLIKDTRNAQVALGYVSIALALALKELGVQPSYFAGHSYGELPALCASGSINIDLLLKISMIRGQLLGQAAEQYPGSMLAINAEFKKIQELIKVSNTKVEIANINSNNQIVVAGRKSDISRMEEVCRGKVNTVKLKASGAFHSSLMSSAVLKWNSFLNDVSKDRMGFEGTKSGKVYSNVTAKEYCNGSKEIVDHLTKQITQSVRWQELCNKLYEDGARVFIEVGPGSVLTNLNEANLKGKQILNIRCDPKNNDSAMHLVNVIGRLASHCIPVKWDIYMNRDIISDFLKSCKPRGNGDMEKQIEMQYISTASEYFRSNQSVIEKYFDEQGKMIELLYSSFSEADKNRLITQLLNANKEVMLNAFETQRVGALYFSKEANYVGEIECVKKESDKNSLVQSFKEEQQGINLEECVVKEIKESKRHILGNWLKNELSRITGFPCDVINDSTHFEEDLGLISINIVEIFAHLTNEFPEYKNEDIYKAVMLPTLGEMVDFLTSYTTEHENGYNENLKESIENWLKGELSRVTGFSTDMITGDTRFEEDLGLMSINMLELYAHFQNDFPELKKNLEDIIGVSSVREFIEALTENDVNKNRENEIEDLDSNGDELNKLLFKIEERISDMAGISKADITFRESFHDLDINIFTLEKVYDELLGAYPHYSLFKQELLSATNFEQVQSNLKYIVPVEDSSKQNKSDEKVDSSKECDISEVQRYVFDYEKLNLSQDGQLPKSILLVGEMGGAYEYFHKSITSIGIKVKTLFITDSGWKLTLESVDTIEFDNHGELGKYLDLYRDNSGRLPSLVFLAMGEGDPLENGEYNQWNKHVEHSAVALFAISKFYSLQRDANKGKKGKGFISILGQTNLCPAWSSARGFARSLTHDIGDSYDVRSVWLKDVYSLIPFEYIINAICSGPTEYDMFIDLNCIMKRNLKHQSIKKSSANSMHVEPGSLFLLTGGGDGITAEVACLMAKQYKCKIAVIGRTAYSDVIPYGGIEDNETLRRAVFEGLKAELGTNGQVTRDIMEQRLNMVNRQRAILNTKKRVEAAGGEFYYYSCDVSKPDELNETVKFIMSRHGEIAGLVHGAGNISKQSKKTLESFKSVLFTKTHSAFCFYQLFKNYPLKFVLLFSSITAYTGRPGLTDYSAGNELINEFALYWNERAEYPVRSIMWSLWTETGLLRESQYGVEHLGLKGVSNIVGTELFKNEFEHLNKAEDRVLLTHDSILKYSMP